VKLQSSRLDFMGASLAVTDRLGGGGDDASSEDGDAGKAAPSRVKAPKLKQDNTMNMKRSYRKVGKRPGGE
jgi:hypothetical protein